MRKFTLLLSAMALGAIAAHAQTVATFEDLTLPGTDTFYMTYSNPGNDVGFDDGLAHFPCVYDTSNGYGYWSSGFAYSDVTDSTTSGFANNYGAKAYKGYNGSNTYVVVSASTYSDNILPLKPAAQGKPVSGFYITNGTYAYNSMRDGDPYAKMFTNADKDWFKVTIRGYRNNALTTDSVDFYLADFRFTDSTQDYIVKDWRWVDLSSLGHVDSLNFTLSSSDNGQFGMNTPAYFCMDNFTTNETEVAVKNVTTTDAKIYPNPATDKLYVELTNDETKQVSICDMSGRVLHTYSVSNRMLAINTASLPSGMYLLQLYNGSKTTTARFVKQ